MKAAYDRVLSTVWTSLTVTADISFKIAEIASPSLKLNRICPWLTGIPRALSWKFVWYPSIMSNDLYAKRWQSVSLFFLNNIVVRRVTAYVLVWQIIIDILN